MPLFLNSVSNIFKNLPSASEEYKCGRILITPLKCTCQLLNSVGTNVIIFLSEESNDLSNFSSIKAVSTPKVATMPCVFKRSYDAFSRTNIIHLRRVCFARKLNIWLLLLLIVLR